MLSVPLKKKVGDWLGVFWFELETGCEKREAVKVGSVTPLPL